jgi:hypothetical protein
MDPLDVPGMRAMCLKELEYNGDFVTAAPGAFLLDDGRDDPYNVHPSILHARIEFPKPPWCFLAHAPVQAWLIDMIKSYEESTASTVPSAPPHFSPVEDLDQTYAVQRLRNVDLLRSVQREPVTEGSARAQPTI